MSHEENEVTLLILTSSGRCLFLHPEYCCLKNDVLFHFFNDLGLLKHALIRTAKYVNVHLKGKVHPEQLLYN